MNKSNSTTDSQVTIKWSEIYVDPERNSREDMAKVPELAELLKKDGQINPVGVENGGNYPGGKPYRLVWGYKRMAAFKELGWTKREILAVVRKYGKDDVLGPFVDNWAENASHESLSAVDQAKFLWSLVKGTYKVDEGQVAVPIEKKLICERFSIRLEHLNKLVRTFEAVKEDPELVKMAQKENIPFRELITAATVSKKQGSTEAGKGVFKKYLENQKALKDAGRVRGQRKDKKSKSKKGEEAPPAVQPTKKVGVEIAGKARSLETYLEVAKRAAKEAKKEDALILKGVIGTLSFVIGDAKRLPGLTAADFKALDQEIEHKKQAEKEAEAAE